MSARIFSGEHERRFPFPVIPSGWYVAAMSEELRSGQVLARRLFGRELALLRTASGEVRLVDGFCPHMGAHLGHQGRVEGEELVCSFHGMRYGADGRCSGTANGDPPPPAACLKPWSVREQSGMILVWHDAAGREPGWEVPPLPEDGFTPIAWRRFRFPGHPQETTENSVDFGHFIHTHGFPAAHDSGSVRTEGPVLFAHYEIRRAIHKGLLPRLTLRVEFDVTARGLGYSQVDGSLPELRTDVRLFVLPIPVERDEVELVLGASTRCRLRFLSPLISRIAIRMLCNEVAQDIAVWRHKVHLTAPKLTKSEAAIARYRSWCEQFYPESGAAPR
jgi:nitrite reductase/ring-hydroxylating ferredoxin subunit